MLSISRDARFDSSRADALHISICHTCKPREAMRHNTPHSDARQDWVMVKCLPHMSGRALSTNTREPQETGLWHETCTHQYKWQARP